MSAAPGYHGRRRREDGPRTDTSMRDLSDAYLALAKAAIVVGTDQSGEADAFLDTAEMVAFEFEPGSDAAEGLRLGIATVRRALEATS